MVSLELPVLLVPLELSQLEEPMPVLLVSPIATLAQLQLESVLPVPLDLLLMHKTVMPVPLELSLMEPLPVSLAVPLARTVVLPLVTVRVALLVSNLTQMEPVLPVNRAPSQLEESAPARIVTSTAPTVLLPLEFVLPAMQDLPLILITALLVQQVHSQPVLPLVLPVILVA